MFVDIYTFELIICCFVWFSLPRFRGFLAGLFRSTFITEMASLHNSEAVVIDNGTGFLKAGFAGEDSPTVVLPTTTNFLQKIHMGNKANSNSDENGNTDNSSSNNNSNDNNNNDNNNSNNNSSSAAGAAYKRPIRRGVIEDWDSMTAAWRYILHHELGMDPESPEFPVVLTDSPLATRKDREKMAEIMFETFNVPGLYIGSQAVFSLYASGRTRGIVLECKFFSFFSFLFFSSVECKKVF